jgi:cell division initiation protein
MAHAGKALTETFFSVNSQVELSPADVIKMEFSSARRGADPEQVRKFLSEVAAVLERLYTERETLKERIAKLEERAAEFRQMEQVLAKTLEEAHETADRLRKSAEEDAECIIKETNKEADRILSDAKQELEGIKSHIRSLNGQRLAFLEEMEATLESYRKILERLKKETADNETAD